MTGSLSSSIEQTAQLDGRTFLLRRRWNNRAQAWFLDVWDADGAPVALSVRIVVDVPLLHRYGGRSGRPAGDLVAIDTTSAGVDPGFEDLGARVQLVYLTAADMREAVA